MRRLLLDCWTSAAKLLDRSIAKVSEQVGAAQMCILKGSGEQVIKQGYQARFPRPDPQAQFPSSSEEHAPGFPS